MVFDIHFSKNRKQNLGESHRPKWQSIANEIECVRNTASQTMKYHTAAVPLHHYHPTHRWYIYLIDENTIKTRNFRKVWNIHDGDGNALQSIMMVWHGLYVDPNHLSSPCCYCLTAKNGQRYQSIFPSRVTFLFWLWFFSFFFVNFFVGGFVRSKYTWNGIIWPFGLCHL